MANEGEILLTVFLRHQQDKNLGEINARLDATGFWKQFPPQGIEVEFWYVMMGIGQVVTLRVPAPARSEPRTGEMRLGRLFHRVLSDVRFPSRMEKNP